MSTLSPEATLPGLRTELKILPGIREVNGLKSWLIFDPVRHLYFQIDDKNHGILSHWNAGTVAELIRRAHYTETSIEDIEEMLRFLWTNCLTQQPPEDDHSFYLKQAPGKQSHWLYKLIHSYLFLVLPLVRPSRLLKLTEPLTRVFFSYAFGAFVFLCGLLSLFLASRQWDQFVHTFLHFFSLKGLVYYAVALTLVKIAHELGHAYAATRYGCKVKSMGVAFIVMFPVLYTDTTDTWRLTDRKKRLIVDAAGVAVELTLAIFATLIWCFSADGAVKSAAFFVATTSWIMSLFINMNPLMRFDAYYFLSDLIGVQNLQNRSFNIGKWTLRQKLFNLQHPQPESLPVRLSRGLTLLAWATWIYRFFLFLGIALLVHNLFYQPFGAILASIELYFFIVTPIMRELLQWYQIRSQIFTSARTWGTLVIFSTFLLGLIIPWQSKLNIPAVIEPARSLEQFSQSAAYVKEIHVHQGQKVEADDLIIELESIWLKNRQTIVEREIQLRSDLLARTAADTEDLSRKIVIEHELAQYKEELSGLNKLQDQLRITAAFSGTIEDLNPNLHVGRWINDGFPLFALNSTSGISARGFIEEHQLTRVQQGVTAKFLPDIPELEALTGNVTIVDIANADYININALTSEYGGPIAVNREEENMKPIKTWYHLSASIGDLNQTISQMRKGVLVIQGTPESIIRRVSKRIASVLLRELHF